MMISIRKMTQSERVNATMSHCCGLDPNCVQLKLPFNKMLGGVIRDYTMTHLIVP